ncbi:MAG TPA: PilZ domain-containing protein [Magnetovibrio sp.]
MSQGDDWGDDQNDNPAAAKGQGAKPDTGTRRQATRLTTVYGGRICQFGKAYPCIISDVSAGGVKVRLKEPGDFARITKTGEVQLIFERLTDYKALNSVVAWVKPDEHTVGLRFTDPELRRRLVMKRLMPNRWRLANAQHEAENTEDNP